MAMEGGPRGGQGLVLEPTDAGVERAASILRSGGIVAFPTETVYGLGANALDEAAVLSIFEAKGRPLTDPLIVHVEDTARALELVDIHGEERDVFEALAGAFWPGPLTLIAKAAPCIPSKVTAGTGFVGVRVPAHPLARRLIAAAGLPVAAPSANRFGHVSPTRAEHVVADLGGKGVMVLSGEGEGAAEGAGAGAAEAHPSCEHGIESTVAKVDGAARELVIFRQGAAGHGAVERAVGAAGGGRLGWTVRAVVRTVNMHAAAPAAAAAPPTEGQEAPGQAITHYAPDVPCVVVSRLHTGAAPAAPAGCLDLGGGLGKAVVIDYGGQLGVLRAGALAYRDLSPSRSAKEAARELFATLRWAEVQAGAVRVLLPVVADDPEEGEVGEGAEVAAEGGGIGLGVADRIFRAASGSVREVYLG